MFSSTDIKQIYTTLPHINPGALALSQKTHKQNRPTVTGASIACMPKLIDNLIVLAKLKTHSSYRNNVINHCWWLNLTAHTPIWCMAAYIITRIQGRSEACHAPWPVPGLRSLIPQRKVSVLSAHSAAPWRRAIRRDRESGQSRNSICYRECQLI